MAEAVRVSSGTLSVENGVANFVNVKIQLSGVSNTSVHKIVIPGKENMSSTHKTSMKSPGKFRICTFDGPIWVGWCFHG